MVPKYELACALPPCEPGGERCSGAGGHTGMRPVLASDPGQGRLPRPVYLVAMTRESTLTMRMFTPRNRRETAGLLGLVLK
jgi:hypothetical protein